MCQQLARYLTFIMSLIVRSSHLKDYVKVGFPMPSPPTPINKKIEVQSVGTTVIMEMAFWSPILPSLKSGFSSHQWSWGSDDWCVHSMDTGGDGGSWREEEGYMSLTNVKLFAWTWDVWVSFEKLGCECHTLHLGRFQGQWIYQDKSQVCHNKEAARAGKAWGWREVSWLWN